MGVRLNTIGAATIVMAAALGIGSYAITMRPDISRGAHFVFSDQGHNLQVSAVLAAGGRLYQDVFTPYGPLTAWAAFAAARIGGNTPVAYETLLLTLNTVALTLVFLTLRRLTSPAWAMLLTLVCALPAMLAPGSMLGGLTTSPYVALERCVFAALLWTWRPPDGRTWQRTLVIGVIAGLCQWVRFGTVVLAVAGVVAADVMAARTGDSRRTLLRQLAGVAAGVVAVQLALVVWAYAVLPAEVAGDVLWPAYFVPSYDWVTLAERWPALSWPLAVLQYGAAIAGLVFAPFVLWRMRRSPAAPIIAFLICAYLVGAAGLFRHAHHFRQYAWWLALAAAVAAAAGGIRIRAAVLALSTMVLVTMLRAVSAAPAAGVWVPTPASGALYLTSADAEDVAALNALAATFEARGQVVVAGPVASGWYALFGHPAPGRHTWFLSAVVRPRESDAIAGALSAAGAIVVCGPSKTLDALNLPDVITARLAREFAGRRSVSNGCEAYVRE